jgi:hypothetical protein
MRAKGSFLWLKLSSAAGSKTYVNPALEAYNHYMIYSSVVELVDTRDLKSLAQLSMRVRFPPELPFNNRIKINVC